MKCLEQLLILIDPLNKEQCYNLYYNNYERLTSAPGSSHNHQAWPGGYIDHIEGVMNIALNLYESLSKIRMLPFKVEDALLVLFLHDLEKPWKKDRHEFWTKYERKIFRANKIAEYGIILTPEQQNAILYVEGEGNDYKPDARVMNELAAFCHMCDVASARIWHDC